jgi:hypothetical protein
MRHAGSLDNPEIVLKWILCENGVRTIDLSGCDKIVLGL